MSELPQYFDYTKAVAATDLVIELYELEQRRDLVNDLITQCGEKMKYREMYRMLEKHHDSTMTRFYMLVMLGILQSGMIIYLAIA